jgi:hypothetical protein
MQKMSAKGCMFLFRTKIRTNSKKYREEHEKYSNSKNSQHRIMIREEESQEVLS